MNKHSRILLIFAALFGTASVALAAAGAHAFHDNLVAVERLDTFGKAVNYAMYGALATLACATLHGAFSDAWFFLCGYLFVLGTGLFSGALFLYTLMGLDGAAVVTPFGGVTLIIAWVSLAFVAIFSSGAQR